LFRFFELFLEHGYPYLIKFGISLVKTCKDQILTAADHQIYAVLRFDESVQVSPGVKLAVVEEAASIDLSKYDLENLRKLCFEKYLKPRLDNANDALQNVVDDDSDEEEEGAECEVCGEMAPDVYCKDCQKMLCGMCTKTKKGGHTSKHSTEDWEQYQKKTDKGVDEITKDVKKLSLQ